MSKTRNVSCLITDKNIFSRHHAFGFIRRLALRPNGSPPPAPPRVTQTEMPPRLDEWHRSHFHLWGWEYSHGSAVMLLGDWNVFVRFSLCERNTRLRRVEEDERIFFVSWLYFSSSHPIFPMLPPVCHLFFRLHSCFNLLTNGRCSSGTPRCATVLPAARLLRSYFLIGDIKGLTNLKKGAESFGWITFRQIRDICIT